MFGKIVSVNQPLAGNGAQLWPYLSVLFGVLVGFNMLAMAADDLPPRPVNPTIQECDAWNRQINLALKDAYGQTATCMKGPIHFGNGKECTAIKHKVVQRLQAWSQCDFTEDIKCALYQLQDNDVPACYAEANQNASQVDKAKLAMAEVNEVESQVKDKIALAQDIETAWNDPKRFIAEKVRTKTMEWIKENLLGPNDRFTGQGERLAQETYDFIFNRTIGNAALRASNPIIAGIEESAADQIRKAHSQALAQIEQIISEAGQVGVQNPPPAMPIATPPRAPATSLPMTSPPAALPAECAVLDSSARTNLAIDDPGRYEELLAICKHP